MIDSTRLAVFIPTFFMVSITPGMCMTLALTMGMSVGFKKTLWMMAGELAGVAIVVTLTVAGVAKIMLDHPMLFIFLKVIGGGYLIYSGVKMFRSDGSLNLSKENFENSSGLKYTFQGFITAIANPKGWAFTISLLPPFINPDIPVFSQLLVLTSIILSTELICMIMYASGGNSLRSFLNKGGKVGLLNKISGTLMVVIGIWLAVP